MDRTICYHSASLPCLGGCVPPRDGYIVHGCSGTYFAAKYLEVSQGVCDLASSVGSWPRTCMYDRERTVYMSGCSPLGSEPAPHACAFYRRALLALQAAQVPFLVGGGYSLAHYVGIIRHAVCPRGRRRGGRARVGVSKIADAAAHCCATLLAYSGYRRGRAA